MTERKKVSYFYDSDVGQFYYGQGHPMKPHRVRMAHSLILHYGLYNQMQVYKPRLAQAEDMVKFHEEDYINFLRNVNPENEHKFQEQLRTFNMGEDCPVFDGLFQYCQISAGGSVGGAVKLNYRSSDVVINWAGGLHHAKKAEASGFCYVNDIVLAILELLKYHQRVLYIDIDVHHGDGVEEAFLTTDRVMTVSFHKFGANFFPGTGDIVNVGHGPGRHYALNVPLKDGISDEAYQSLFQPVMTRIMQVYQPEAIVFQSGADSLAGDRLGCFNLSMRGHAQCLRFMLAFNVPTLVLGGGGYKISNVARCWAYETGAVLGVEMPDQLPPNEYFEYYGPNYRLHIPTNKDRENLNSKEYLDKIKIKLLEHISCIKGPPGVAFHERPPDAMPEPASEQPGIKGEDRDEVWREQGGGHGERGRLWNGNGGGYNSDDEQEASGRARHERNYGTASDEPGTSGQASKQSNPLYPSPPGPPPMELNRDAVPGAAALMGAVAINGGMGGA